MHWVPAPGGRDGRPAGRNPLARTRAAGNPTSGAEALPWTGPKVYAAIMADTIGIDAFEQVEIRVGTIVDARPFPEARKPAYQLWVDFGAPLGVKQSSAQITVHYACDRLIGRQVLGVVNLPPRRIGSFLSEVLVLGLPDENGAVVLIRPDLKVPDGGRMF